MKDSLLKKISPLLRKPYFTVDEARKLGVYPAMLCYYVNTGDLNRVVRGVYQKTGISNPNLFQWEDLIETLLSINEGVACLTSALAIYGLTEELPREQWVGIRHGTTARSRRGVKCVRFRNFELGKTEIKLEGVTIPIYDRERTLVDAFRLLSLETAIKALKAALEDKNKIDLIKLQRYAKKLRVDITPYILSLTT